MAPYLLWLDNLGGSVAQGWDEGATGEVSRGVLGHGLTS